MLKIKNSLSDFNFKSDEFMDLNEHTFFIKKWNWDYQNAWDFQKRCVSLVQEKPSLKFYIACNHPRVLTHGRGLQKPRKGEVLNLVDFDFNLVDKIEVPFFKIERGGGLTFHHPGQFIFYPIVRLNPHELSLSKMTDEIFDFSKDILNQWGLSGISSQNKLLGLWKDDFKIASMGIAISKLVTYHGMALNIYSDEYLKNLLKSMNPCGLQGDIYKAVDHFISPPKDALDRFAESFFNKVNHEWK